MMFDFSEKKKAQVYYNLCDVMQICMERILKHNKDGKGKQDAEALRDDFAYAFHCMDLCSEFRWIPVEERLPEAGTRVFVREKGDFTGIGCFGRRTQKWIEPISGAHLDNVTHWMPLPEPPEV